MTNLKSVDISDMRVSDVKKEFEYLLWLRDSIKRMKRNSKFSSPNQLTKLRYYQGEYLFVLNGIYAHLASEICSKVEINIPTK